MRHRLRHHFGRVRRGNCLLFCLALFLRGRIVRFSRRKGHWVGLTRRGTCVHLKAVTDGDPGWWYRGRPHAFKRG